MAAFLPFAILGQSLLQANQDANNRKDKFDSNMFTLLNSHVTGRQPKSFSGLVGNNDSLKTLGKGLTGAFMQHRANQLAGAGAAAGAGAGLNAASPFNKLAQSQGLVGQLQQQGGGLMFGGGQFPNLGI